MHTSPFSPFPDKSSPKISAGVATPANEATILE